MAQDLDQARSWIDILHGISPGLIHVCHTGNWSGQTFDWSTDSGQERALGYISSQDAQEGIYLRCTTISRQPERGSRGPESDSVALPGLWADMDLAGPGHKTSNPLPVTFEDAKAIIESSGLPQPTLWIHSGGGLYPWWLFDQPLALPESSTLSLAKKLSAQWHDALAAGAEKIGFHYGLGTQDMARVLRLPGTTNRKAGLERPCRIIEQEGRTYSLEEMLVVVARVTPAPAPVAPRVPGPGSGGIRPGDDFNERADWSDAELLGGAGWTEVARIGREIRWRKPGSRSREHHATTGREGLGADDRLWVFSTETEFDPQTPLTKFHVYAVLHHGGDYSAATKALAAMEYGESLEPSRPRASLSEFAWTPPVGSEWVEVDPEADPKIAARESFTDTGMANRFVREFSNRFLYVRTSDAKRASGFWRYFDGVIWTERSADRRIDDAVEAMLDVLEDEAKAFLKGDGEDLDLGKALHKYVRSARSYGGFASLRNQIANKLAIAPSAFDIYPHLVGLKNGVLDVKAAKVVNSRPEYMITKQLGVKYDPAASAPDTERYLAQVIPDEGYRDYVQRGLGYTLTGEQDQRAFFILHGDPGTGKSQFLELFASVFGDYANAAADGAFRKRHAGSNGPMAELHDLRDSRFIFASENDRAVVYDADVIKRICGNDTMSTRTLYEKKLVNWKAKGVVWLAANDFPQFPAADEAIWDRVKPIPFDQHFPQEAGRITSISERLFGTESSGILNLLISWLKAYRELGLVEPKAVRVAAKEKQDEANPVARWFDENREVGEFVESDVRAEWMTGEVAYQHFMGWYRMNFGKTFFEARSFFTLLRKHLKYEKLDKSNSVRRIPGWRSIGSRGLLGTMGGWS